MTNKEQTAKSKMPLAKSDKNAKKRCFIHRLYPGEVEKKTSQGKQISRIKKI